MDIPRSFTFVFEDERWIGKLMIAAMIGLLSILIVPAFLLSGYSVAITRRVIAGDKSPLPEWDDWGVLFKDGLALFLIQLVYGAPIWLLFGCGIVFTAVLGSGFDNLSEDALAGGIFGIWGLVSCVAVLMGLLIALVIPVATVRYARSGEVSAALRVGEVLREVRDNIGQIVLIMAALIAVTLLIVAGFGILGLIPCLGWIASLIGSLLLAPYLTFATGHLYGQLAHAMGAAPAAKSPIDL